MHHDRRRPAHRNVLGPALLAVALAVLFGAPAASFAHGTLQLTGGVWWDGASFQPRTMYSVEGVLVAHHDGPVDRTVDLGGGFVVPPYADAHTHGFGWTEPGAVERHLAAGIFYLKNPNSVASDTVAVRPKVNLAESVDVSYALGGITATGGHPVQIWENLARQLGREPATMRDNAYWVVDDARDLAAVWPRLLAGRPDFVKIYLERSELPVPAPGSAGWLGGHGLPAAVVPAIVARAHADGLRVTAHVTSAADFRVAVAAGADEIAHLPLERLAPADATAAAAAGTVVVTTALSHRPVPPGVDAPAVHRDNLRLLRDAGVRLAIGTDSHANALDEVEHLAALGALDARELLVALVETTPATIFPGRKIGRLAEGYEASFLVLGGNPLVDLSALRDVRLRVKRGHLLAVGAAAPAPAHRAPAHHAPAAHAAPAAPPAHPAATPGGG
jgi:hypothetical protein